MIRSIQNRIPEIHESCYIAETASVIGKVIMKEKSSIWFGVTIRGDYNDVSIGAGTNIQDNSVIHIGLEDPTTIGDYVTVGHGAIVHGCTIKDRVLIGMGAILLNGAIVESDSIIAAGSLVPEGRTIPSGVLAMGSPAKVVRQLTPEERAGIVKLAEDYIGFSKRFLGDEPTA